MVTVSQIEDLEIETTNFQSSSWWNSWTSSCGSQKRCLSESERDSENEDSKGEKWWSSFGSSSSSS